MATFLFASKSSHLFFSLNRTRQNISLCDTHTTKKMFRFCSNREKMGIEMQKKKERASNCERQCRNIRIGIHVNVNNDSDMRIWLLCNVSGKRGNDEHSTENHISKPTLACLLALPPPPPPSVSVSWFLRKWENNHSVQWIIKNEAFSSSFVCTFVWKWCVYTVWLWGSVHEGKKLERNHVHIEKLNFPCRYLHLVRSAFFCSFSFRHPSTLSSISVDLVVQKMLCKLSSHLHWAIPTQCSCWRFSRCCLLRFSLK